MYPDNFNLLQFGRLIAAVHTNFYAPPNNSNTSLIMAQQSFTTQLLPSLSSKLGILQLNNPTSLNALTIEMIRSMCPTLSAWQNGGGVNATLMIGTPYEKNGKSKPAFCAGGDVKAVYLAGIAKKDANSDTSSLLTTDFFREEYQLNHLIATQPPHMPQVSIWDGVVMGGGVGLSVHGKYRVATEKTIFAMPGKDVYVVMLILQ